MKYLLLLTAIALLFSCAGDHTKVYEWRGEDRAGIYQETGLLKEWPEEGPEELWSIEDIGDGYGSPLFVEDKFYVSGSRDSIALLFCFDLNGKELWKMEFGKEWVVNFPGSRSAPTVVDNLLYISSGMGNLFCIDVDAQKIIWSKDFDKDFEGILPRFGHSESILTDGDKVFFTPGGKVHNVVALNRFDGELIWSNPGFSERSGYNPPKLIKLEERNILVTFSAYYMMGFDTETGEMLWSHEQDNYPVEEHGPGVGDTHSNTVLFEDGSIYYAEGDGNCGVRLDLSEDGKEITEVWRNKGFDSYMGGIVKIDDHVYGTGFAARDIRSININTGELTDSLKIGPGVVIAADEMLYYYSLGGKLNLLSYDMGKMELISSFRVKKGTKEHFAHPVIYRGVLYQRHGRVLLAYNIKAEA